MRLFRITIRCTAGCDCQNRGMSQPGIRRAAVAISAALLLPLSSCAFPGTTAETCIDWVHFESPADAADEADAVAIGRIVNQTGTTDYLDMPATTWNVIVEDWVSGDHTDAVITVTSLPRGCGDSTDAIAEAADGDDLVVLYLRDSDDGWQTLTPLQGTVALGPDGGVPSEWPMDPAIQTASGGDPVGQWGEIGDGKTFLTLSEGGTVTGNDGCNGTGGTWRLDGSVVYFDDMIMTLVMCEGQDSWLQPVTTALVDGDTLHILDENGYVKGTLPRIE